MVPTEPRRSRSELSGSSFCTCKRRKSHEHGFRQNPAPNGRSGRAGCHPPRVPDALPADPRTEALGGSTQPGPEPGVRPRRHHHRHAPPRGAVWSDTCGLNAATSGTSVRKTIGTRSATQRVAVTHINGAILLCGLQTVAFPSLNCGRSRRVCPYKGLINAHIVLRIKRTLAE